MYNEIEQKVFEHDKGIQLIYYIKNDILVKNFKLNYTSNNSNILIEFEEKTNYGFSVFLKTISMNEYNIKIICKVTLCDESQLLLSDDVYIFSRNDYDYLSMAFLLDAKFLCYTSTTDTQNPTFVNMIYFIIILLIALL